MRHRRPGATHQGDQVQFHQVAELLRRGVQHLAAHRAAGVVHQHVQPPESLDRLRDHPIDVVLPGDVGVDAQHVAAGRLHLGGRLLRPLGLQGGDDDLAAGGGELLGDHAAQAAGTTGDEGDFVLPEGHGDRGPALQVGSVYGER